MYKSFFILVLIFLGSACLQTPKSKRNCNFSTIESLKNDLLFLNVSEINAFKNCYDIVIQEIVDDEDNNIKWGNYNFYKHGRILFEAETSWEKKNNIQRITILDSSLSFSGNIHVGQFFKEFKHKIKYGYWDESYGKFYVSFSKDDQISIELNEENQSTLAQWEKDLTKITDNVKVATIIINQNH